MKVYDVAAKVGEYQTQDGKTKGRWQNVGAVMEGKDGGQYLMLAKWFNPAGVPDARGGESILLSLFPPRERGQQQTAHQASQAAQAPKDFDDQIPF